MLVRIMQGVVYQVIYIIIALARIGLVGLELPLAYAAHIFGIFKVLVLVRKNALVSKHTRPYASPSYARGGLRCLLLSSHSMPHDAP